jgi:predicted PurR-regulated permease PerM
MPDGVKNPPQRIIIPWYYSRFFKYTVGILLVLLIIFIFYQVAFLLAPFINFASSLFAPLAIALLFYYLLRPIVYKLEEYRVARVVTILLLYGFIALLLILFFSYVGPILAEQVTALANTSVKALEKMETNSQFVTSNLQMRIQNEIQQKVMAFAQQATAVLSQNLLVIVGYVTHLATILAVIPFIVFYLLKSDNDFSASFLDRMPEDYAKEVKKILKNIDLTLANFITGVVIVSGCVGLMLYIGYLIIGLDYALILSVMAIVFMTIPFLGPFLAFAPALLIGFTMSQYMAFKVSIVFIIVQQIEANFLSPQVLGHKLNIHPLTLILILLAAGTLYGIVGLLLATPAYAVLKVLVTNLYKIYQLKYPRIQKKLAETS